MLIMLTMASSVGISETLKLCRHLDTILHSTSNAQVENITMSSAQLMETILGAVLNNVSRSRLKNSMMVTAVVAVTKLLRT